VWKPSLVILRVDRAALDCAWSPNGLKFAVASGSKCVPICHFEAEHDWWVSKMIKKHKSTVLCVAWHPNSQIVATGSSDFKCRVFSAFVSDIDKSHDTGPFDKPAAFGEVYAEYGAYGWIDSVAWSPSGEILAFSGHDSSIQFVNYESGGSGAVAEAMRFRELPFHKIMFLNESELIGVGHEMNPILWQSKRGAKWSMVKKLDDGNNAAEKVETEPIGTKKVFSSARALFQNKASKGQDVAVAAVDKLKTLHEACISSISKMSDDTEFEITKFSTVAFDGRLTFWDMKKLA
jgi:actin related protein 2/3 complex subunit 1A/1B